MKGTVTLENGQVVEIEINEEQLAQLQVKSKKTGYERVEENSVYYYVKSHGNVDYFTERVETFDCVIYKNANYYSDQTVAENNARADRLMRQLRRFAVENRKEELDWDLEVEKYHISYKHNCEGLCLDSNTYWQTFGAIYFDTEEAAQKAINTFRDELIWYFTEYKDSL